MQVIDRKNNNKEEGRKGKNGRVRPWEIIYAKE